MGGHSCRRSTRLAAAFVLALTFAAQAQEPGSRPWKDTARLQAEVDGLVPRVERALGLCFREPPKVRFPEIDEWRRMVARELPGERDQYRAGVLLYGVFLVPEREVWIGEYVAFHLLGESKRTFARCGLAHELAHALGEQHFQFGARHRAEPDATARLYRKALSEGFAVMAELRVAHELGGDAAVREALERYRGPAQLVHVRGHRYLQNLEHEHGREAMWQALAGALPRPVEFARGSWREPGPVVARTADGTRDATATHLRIEVAARGSESGASGPAHAPARPRVWDLPAPARRLAFSADGALLAAVGVDGALRVIDVREAAPATAIRSLFCGAVEFTFTSQGGEVVDRDGTKVVFARDQLQPGPGASVDLRPELRRLGLPIRKQGTRGTCSVFTAAGAYEFALSRAAQRGVVLSVEFLNWAANEAVGRVDDGSFFADVVAGYEKHGACREAAWPYARDFDPGSTPGPAAVAEAAALRTRRAHAHWIQPWTPQAGLRSEHLDAIRTTLQRGWPVCLGSAHSTLAVGYRDDASLPGGGVLLVRDSATGSDREVDFEFVQKRVGDVFWVEQSGP